MRLSFQHLLCGLLCASLAGVAQAAAYGAPQELYQNDDTAEQGEGVNIDSQTDEQLATPNMNVQPIPQPIMRQHPQPMGYAPAAIAAPAPIVRRSDYVEKDELAAPVLTNYGILDEKTGSLPMDIWKVFNYPEATGLLNTSTQIVNAGTGNAAFKDVLRAVALSKAYEPVGSPEIANAFFNARVMAAQAAGDSAGALTLAKTREASLKPADWQVFIEQELRQRRVVDACVLTAQYLPATSNVFAQKMGILCSIKDGKADAARLNLDLLRESGDGDTLFLELAERALAPNVVPKKQTTKFENLSVLHVAAIAIGRVKIKAENIDSMMSPPQPILLDIPMSDVQRIKLAEQFARTRQIASDVFNAVISGVKFPAKSIEKFRANPETLLTVPEKEWPAPLRRAAAIRSIIEEENSAQKAHIIAAALAGFSNADLLGALGDSLEADVAGLAALPDNLAAAPAMARLMLLRGNKDAQSWWRLASAAPANREALLPLFPLALLRGVMSEDERSAWFESYGRTQMLSSDKKSFNLAMVKSLGVMLPSNVDSQLAAQNVIPSGDIAADRRLNVLLSNTNRDANDAVLRAVLALKSMRQDALAEKLVLLKL